MDSLKKMGEVKCRECGEEGLCRSRCTLCDYYYCVRCRTPPCTKTDCPKKHRYHRSISENYICDICGLSPGLYDQMAYDDVRCNFGFCESCFHRLPEELSVKARQNNYQECD